MSAKEIRFSAEAREKMLRGVDILANAVKEILEFLSNSKSIFLSFRSNIFNIIVYSLYIFPFC